MKPFVDLWHGAPVAMLSKVKGGPPALSIAYFSHRMSPPSPGIYLSTSRTLGSPFKVTPSIGAWGYPFSLEVAAEANGAATMVRLADPATRTVLQVTFQPFGAENERAILALPLERRRARRVRRVMDWWHIGGVDSLRDAFGRGVKVISAEGKGDQG